MDDSSDPRVPSSEPPGAASAPPPPVAKAPPSSGRARRIRWVVTVLLAVTIATAAVGTWLYDRLPRHVDNQQIFILGQTQLAPGAENALRIVVRDTRGAKPIPNANVKVSLAPKGGGRAVTLFTGRSGPDGAVAASFRAPEVARPDQMLIVEAGSNIGRDRVKQDVTVRRSYKLLLTTDKPVYQPAQTIHLRALAFSTLDMSAAAGADIGFLVEDPKGNKVFRQTVKASPYGVAAADFVLASEVINGDYKITVSLGDTASEKTVTVKPYVLPKFAVKVNTERSYYLPGQRVAGTVQCDYFFGKPAADGQVTITGSVFDVQEAEVVNIQGRTDANGAYRFEFDLPEYLAGGGLESGQAEFNLHVAVVDQAEHTEQASRALPIAQNPILIEAIPEAGRLKPGVENRLYLLTSYPDGLPASTRLSLDLDGKTVGLETGEYGLAEYTFVPNLASTIRLSVSAADRQGRQADRVIELAAETGGDVVLLRPDQATYRLGDTMHLVALTSQSFGQIYLDIVKDGQTLSTRSLPTQDGRAEFAVDLSGDLFGALTLHAYKVRADGSLARDTRLVVVDAPRDLTTDIQADHEVYRPGDTAKLSFVTRSEAGPVRSALGVAVVDESVFAVMEQDPGFAKLYFLLQKELLEPKYQIKGFTLPEVLTKTQDVQLLATQDRAARAAWAPLPAGALPLNVNSRPLKIQAAEANRNSGLNRMSNLTLIALILVPLGLWVTTIIGLRASGVLGKAFGRFALLALVLSVVGPCSLIGFFTGFTLLVDMTYYRGGGAARIAGPLAIFTLGAFLLGWLAAVIGLAVYAWRRRDERARIIWLLLVAWVALGVVLAVALSLNALPDSWLGFFALLAYLAGLLALLFFAVGLYIEGRRWPAFVTAGIVLLFIPALIAAAGLPGLVQQVPLVGTLGNPMVYSGPAGWLAGCAPAGGGRGPSSPFDLLGGVRMSAMPAPTAAAGMDVEAQKGSQPQPEEAPASQAPRVRQFFPETLLWLPELETDDSGSAALDVPLADSITTWRVTALASTQDGRLGFNNAALRVFQDFFVDIDLPVALTQNDEVAIPVAVYNYLPEAQEVRLEVAPDSWFELQDERSQTLQIAANDIEVVYFRIKVTGFGERDFQVSAYGDKMNDAIKRRVAVLPDGRLFRKSQSDWLRQGTIASAAIPTGAISGTARIELKIYPGVVAQVVEGLEKILRLPYG